jgi:glycerol kinase
LVYVQLGRIPDAINALRKASVLEPDQPEFSGQAALIALKANRFADAIQDARAALRIAPNHRPALLALGAALLAGLAEGFWASLEEISDTWAVGARFHPVADRTAVDAAHQHWLRAVERSTNWDRQT